MIDLAFRKALLNTILWFDLFDFPLTAREAWEWLFAPERPVSSDAVEEQLRVCPEIEEADGRWFLQGRRALISIRRERELFSQRKLGRALRAARWLRSLPFVRFIAVTNTLAYGNARQESDIDLFIISKDRHLFTARFFVTLACHLLGVRRHGAKITDRLCLSFYISEDALDLSSLRLSGRDPYFAFWLGTLEPLVDLGVGERFWSANAWLATFLPHRYAHGMQAPMMSPSRLARGVQWLLEVLLGFSFVEHALRMLQLWKMRRHPCATNRLPNASVVVSNSVLKFHEDDRREQFREAFAKRCQEFGV